MTAQNKVADLGDIGSDVSAGISPYPIADKPRSRSNKAERLERENRGIVRLGEFDLFDIRGGQDIRGDSIALAVSRSIAAKYHVDYMDLYDVTLLELAQWVGDKGHDRRKDTRRNLTVIEQRLASIRDHSTAMFNKFARNRAPKMNTGRGIRPKLTYRDDLIELADSMQVNGKPLTDMQRALWVNEAGYERAESDMYSPYLTSMGKAADVIGTDSVHAYGAQPIGLPEIESAGLRHSDILERLAAVNCSKADRELVVDSLASVRTSKRKLTDDDGNVTREYRHNVQWVNVRLAAKARGDRRGQKPIRKAVERVLTALSKVDVSTDRVACNDASYPVMVRHKGMPYWYMDAVIEPNIPVKDKSVQEDIPLMGWDNLNDCGHDPENHPTDCPVRVARRARIEAIYSLPTGEDKTQSRLEYHRTLRGIGATLS